MNNNWEQELDRIAEIDTERGVIHATPETLKSFIRHLLSSQIATIREKVENKRKVGNNGEGLPFENSPDIFGNERVESYKKGYNQAVADLLALPELQDTQSKE